MNIEQLVNDFAKQSKISKAKTIKAKANSLDNKQAWQDMQ